MTHENDGKTMAALLGKAQRNAGRILRASSVHARAARVQRCEIGPETPGKTMAELLGAAQKNAGRVLRAASARAHARRAEAWGLA